MQIQLPRTILKRAQVPGGRQAKGARVSGGDARNWEGKMGVRACARARIMYRQVLLMGRGLSSANILSQSQCRNVD